MESIINFFNQHFPKTFTVIVVVGGLIWSGWFVGGRLENYRGRFAKVETDIVQLKDAQTVFDGRLTRVEARLDRLEEKVDRIDERLTKLEVKVDRMDEKLDFLISVISPGTAFKPRRP